MANIDFSKERKDYALNVIVQYLRDAGYEGSLEDGTGLSDIVIKPNTILYEMFAEMVDKATAHQSLSKALELKDTIGDDEYDAAVDGILSNWFVTRNDGKPAYGTVRLWFIEPRDYMKVTDGDTLGTIDQQEIVVNGDQVFTESSFACVLNTTDNVNEYYVDVAVRTSENYGDAITTESSCAVQYDDIYFTRAEIPATFTDGVLMESSEDFIRRTEKVITTRELITERAIQTVLMDKFSEIIRLYVARHGSREQLRDIVVFQYATCHIGNKADIYIASQLTKTRVPVNIDPTDGSIDVSQLPTSVTIVGYIEDYFQDADGNDLNPDGTAKLVLTCEEKSWCSHGMLPITLTATNLVLPDGHEGPVYIQVLTDPVLKEIHDFVYDEAQRVACYDPMVKHMFPMIIKPTLHLELVDSEDEDVVANTIDTAKRITREYAAAVVKAGQPWICSELVTLIHDSDENVKKVHLPVECTGTIFDPESSAFIDVTINNKFSVDTYMDEPHSRQVTSSTVQFYTDDDYITIVIE